MNASNYGHNHERGHANLASEALKTPLQQKSIFTTLMGENVGRPQVRSRKKRSKL